MKKNNNSQQGQAIMEMVIIMVALVSCIIGMFVVMSLSFANIELLMTSKTNAEFNAYDKSHGNDGQEIKQWEYTVWGNKETGTKIPFSPHDKIDKQRANLSNLYFDINFQDYSDAGNEKYAFNDFTIFNEEIGGNFASSPMYVYGYRAANLHESDVSYLYKKHAGIKYLDLANLFLDSRLDINKIIESPGNKVYMPSMKLKYSLK